MIVAKHTPIRDIYHVRKVINTLSTYDLYVVDIKEYNEKTVEVCRQQGYQLKDVREQFDVLWPPLKSNRGYFEVNTNELFTA